MMKIEHNGEEIVVSSAQGRARFVRTGVCQRDIILEFNEGSGRAALEICRGALRYLFENTDTLIVRGRIEKTNAKSRAFVSLLGFTADGEIGRFVGKKMTIAQWIKAYGPSDMAEARRPK